MFQHLKMNLAYQNDLVNLHKFWELGRPPPPSMGKIPKKSRNFCLSAYLTTRGGGGFTPTTKILLNFSVNMDSTIIVKWLKMHFLYSFCHCFSGHLLSICKFPCSLSCSVLWKNICLYKFVCNYLRLNVPLKMFHKYLTIFPNFTFSLIWNWVQTQEPPQGSNLLNIARIL